ncbi:MAG: AraC family transcriptional regulator [Azospirillaceae bacterium]|nr:AraC family transcriptional regulator [Azospirillaceae bacterium]
MPASCQIATASACGPARGGLPPFLVARAKAYMVAREDGAITMAEVAAACGLSRAYFIAAFGRTTGQTPYRWLRRYRVERARDLLVGTCLPIADIAVACGFADQSHLTRVFADVLGVSPAALRRRARCAECDRATEP